MKKIYKAILATLIVALMATTGCVSATVSHSAALRSTAAVDLKCRLADLKVRANGLVGARVIGCGQRARYVWSDDFGNWLLKAKRSDTKNAAASAVDGS